MITLTEMAELVQSMKQADAKVVALEDQLAKAKEQARRLHEETVPGAMQELGLSKLVFEDGSAIVIKNEVYASIPADLRPKAYAWLEENGFGGLIKSEVVIAYGRKELEEAKTMLAKLEEQGLSATLEESVHVMTLKAFLREQLAKGTNVPLDLFGARPVFQAVLK